MCHGLSVSALCMGKIRREKGETWPDALAISRRQPCEFATTANEEKVTFERGARKRNYTLEHHYAPQKTFEDPGGGDKASSFALCRS